MISVSGRKSDASRRPSPAGRTLTISIRLAVPALVLTAILLTAAASGLLWWRTAEATSRQLASWRRPGMTSGVVTQGACLTSGFCPSCQSVAVRCD
jgi:hypothetical protein